MTVLLQKAEGMFPEGQGAPRAMTKDGGAAEKTNELLVNARDTIEEPHGCRLAHPVCESAATFASPTLSGVLVHPTGASGGQWAPF